MHGSHTSLIQRRKIFQRKIHSIWKSRFFTGCLFSYIFYFCLENYFFVIQIREYCATRRPQALLSLGWVGNNGFYHFHYYYIPRVGYGLRDRTDGPKNPTLALRSPKGVVRPGRWRIFGPIGSFPLLPFPTAVYNSSVLYKNERRAYGSILHGSPTKGLPHDFYVL